MFTRTAPARAECAQSDGDVWVSFRRLDGRRGGRGRVLGWPCLVVVGMGVLYQHYGALPQVQQALTGMSSVAAAAARYRDQVGDGVAAALAALDLRRTGLCRRASCAGRCWVMGAFAPWAVFAAWKEQE